MALSDKATLQPTPQFPKLPLVSGRVRTLLVDLLFDAFSCIWVVCRRRSGILLPDIASVGMLLVVRLFRRRRVFRRTERSKLSYIGYGGIGGRFRHDRPLEAGFVHQGID